MIRKSVSVLSICALAVLGVGTMTKPAQATVIFDFSITGGDTGSGTLTATGTSSPFLATSITGTFDGHAITGLAPGAFGADDLLFEPAPFLDALGLAFVRDGKDVDVFFLATPLANYAASVVAAPLVIFLDPVDFTLTPVALPEPASVAIFGTALAGLELIRRRRRRNL